eukprot:1829363-Pyramimonas_sp.AAC.1
MARTIACPWCRARSASGAPCLRRVITAPRPEPLCCPTRATSFDFEPVEFSFCQCGARGRDDTELTD